MIKRQLIFWYILGSLPLLILGQNVSPDLGNKAYELLNLPDLSGDDLSGQVVIAVIDDGFLLSHTSTKDFYLIHEQEIPLNGFDDDGNGYIDDVIGWDAADADPIVEPSEDKLNEYYHGTAVSSIITKIARLSLGDKASDHIKIMPIKIMSDEAQNSNINKGYAGLEYALDNNADIICLAWGGAEIDDSYKALLNRAVQKGVLILGAAGVFDAEGIKAPASATAVNCIAAVDSNFSKIHSSSYGLKVDLSAPGDKVKAAHTSNDNGYISASGTYAATGLVTGCAALLKLKKKTARSFELMAALRNTAQPIEKFNPPYNGLLGAGCPDVANALNYLLNESERGIHFLPSRPEGDVLISRQNSKTPWEFNSSKATEMIHFTLTSARQDAGDGMIAFYDNDSMLYRSSVKDIGMEVEIPANHIKMVFEGKAPKKPISFQYYSVPVDSTILYCDNMEISGTKGKVTDGSGPDKYAHRASCKWIVSVPEGKHLKLDFTEMDIEKNVDFVYVFKGTKTLQENMIAKLSGQSLPPVIITGHHQLLVWFVSNEKNNGQGWKFNYSATDETPGVFER